MKKLNIKILGRFVFCFFLLLAVLSTVISLSLRGSPDLIGRTANPDADRFSMTARGAFYIAPYYLVLKDVTFTALNPGDKIHPVRMPLVILRFSIGEYILRKKFLVDFIHIQQLEGTWSSLSAIGAAYVKVQPSSRRVGFKDMTLKISRGNVQPFIPGFRSQNSCFLLKISSRGQTVKVQAEIRSARFSWRNVWPFPRKESRDGALLDLELKRGPEESVIQSLRVRHPVLEGEWSGVLRADELDLRGYAFMESGWTPVARLRPGSGVFAPDIFVLDISGRLRVSGDEILTEDFTFLLNNIPMKLDGTVFLSSKPLIHMALSAQDPKLQVLAPGLQKASLDLLNEVSPGALAAQMEMRLLFGPPAVLFSGSPLVLRVMDLKYEGTRDNGEISARDLHVLTPDGGFPFEVNFHDLHGRWSWLSKRMGMAVLNGPFYGGSWSGKLWLNNEEGRGGHYASFELKNVDIAEPARALPFPVQVAGRLSGKYWLRNDESFRAQGESVILQGTLTGVKFLDWFAEAFGFASIKQLAFNKLSFTSRYGPEGVAVDRIFLSAAHLQIRGFFRVNPAGMVSSRIGIFTDDALLQESPELSGLLKTAATGEKVYDFEFQLSGPLDAMNIQWLPSGVKELIQARIPDFIERRIENNVDRMMRLRANETTVDAK